MIQINDSNFGNVLLTDVAVTWTIYFISYPFVKKWFRKRGKSLKDLAIKYGYIFTLLSSIPFWLVKVNGRDITFWGRVALIFPIFVLGPIIYYFTLHPLIRSGRIAFRRSMGWRQCEEDMDDTDAKKDKNQK